mmetsp:Transcript_2655/g.4757  ORF Transcript_2655/g.4757 Transcript_2655/m.4757 type:complete len:245 (+) Transcript_2655:481-1215(+)
MAPPVSITVLPEQTAGTEDPAEDPSGLQASDANQKIDGSTNVAPLASGEDIFSTPAPSERSFNDISSAAPPLYVNTEYRESRSRTRNPKSSSRSRRSNKSSSPSMYNFFLRSSTRHLDGANEIEWAELNPPGLEAPSLEECAKYLVNEEIEVQKTSRASQGVFSVIYDHARLALVDLIASLAIYVRYTFTLDTLLVVMNAFAATYGMMVFMEDDTEYVFAVKLDFSFLGFAVIFVSFYSRISDL